MHTVLLCVLPGRKKVSCAPWKHSNFHFAVKTLATTIANISWLKERSFLDIFTAQAVHFSDSQMCRIWTVNDITGKDSLERPQCVFTAFWGEIPYKVPTEVGGLSKLSFPVTSFSLLICTLISENQGLEKSRSTSNPRKLSGDANLNF